MSMKSCGRRSLVVLAGLSFLFSSPVVSSDPDYNFPKCTVEAFYVPALNKASTDATNQTINTTLSLNLKLHKAKPYLWRIYYHTFNISVYYYLHNVSTAGDHLDTLIRLPIGFTSLPRFESHSEYEKHCLQIQTFGVPWEEVKMEVSKGGTTTFRVELSSRVSYTVLLKYFTPIKKHTVELGANVTVNDQGNESVPGGFKLSFAPRHINNPCGVFVLALSVLGFIL